MWIILNLASTRKTVEVLSFHDSIMPFCNTKKRFKVPIFQKYWSPIYSMNSNSQALNEFQLPSTLQTTWSLWVAKPIVGSGTWQDIYCPTKPCFNTLSTYYAYESLLLMMVGLGSPQKSEQVERYCHVQYYALKLIFQNY